MKAVQVILDEDLLKILGSDPEVRRDGRSAVIRRALSWYMRRKRAERISEAYREAYGRGSGVDVELSGWEDEGTWPEE